MSEEVKMSEFFDLPVSDDFVGKMDHGQCVKFVSDGVAEFEAVVHAINNHDRLVEENARLTELAAQKASRADELFEQLTSLFERVSGCSVSDFDESQLLWLADMIEGQMDANEACISSLKSRNTIADYLKVNEAMLTKTKAKMVSIESLKEFAGIKGASND